MSVTLHGPGRGWALCPEGARFRTDCNRFELAAGQTLDPHGPDFPLRRPPEQTVKTRKRSHDGQYQIERYPPRFFYKRYTPSSDGTTNVRPDEKSRAAAWTEHPWPRYNVPTPEGLLAQNMTQLKGEYRHMRNASPELVESFFGFVQREKLGGIPDAEFAAVREFFESDAPTGRAATVPRVYNY